MALVHVAGARRQLTSVRPPGGCGRHLPWRTCCGCPLARSFAVVGVHMCVWLSVVVCGVYVCECAHPHMRLPRPRTSSSWTSTLREASASEHAVRPHSWRSCAEENV